MFGRFLMRIFRRHVWRHLIIPVLVGLLVEGVYRWLTGANWEKAGETTALLAGILLTYGLVMGIEIWHRTKIGLEQLKVHVLATHLQHAKSLFAVGTMRFHEWFDPAVQVYLATIGEQKLRPGTPDFAYERVLLLASRAAAADLNVDYSDGYYAKCLIEIHKRLHTKLYFLEWPQISEVLGQLTPAQKIDLGYYPGFLRFLPGKAQKVLVRPLGRRRVRNLAVGIIETLDGRIEVFRYSKHAKIVNVHFVENNLESWMRLVELIKGELIDPHTHEIRPERDFLHYYPGGG